MTLIVMYRSTIMLSRAPYFSNDSLPFNSVPQLFYSPHMGVIACVRLSEYVEE